MNQTNWSVATSGNIMEKFREPSQEHVPPVFHRRTTSITGTTAIHKTMPPPRSSFIVAQPSSLLAALRTAVQNPTVRLTVAAVGFNKPSVSSSIFHEPGPACSQKQASSSYPAINQPATLALRFRPRQMSKAIRAETSILQGQTTKIWTG